MPTKLSVNVNKIATLRNTRPKLNVPDLVRLSRVALQSGAHGLTIHPRPDERHIRAADVDAVANVVAEFADAEFNIEGNPFEGAYLDHCRRTRPTQCTLVPDSVTQSTSDHGWDARGDGERLKPIVAELKSLGCRVSLFLDPDAAMVESAARIGVDRIELYTEPFATAFAYRDETAATAYAEAAQYAAAAGLAVNAGHDLNLANLPAFLRAVPQVVEVSIGHALVADALEFGLATAVQMYIAACEA